MTPNDKLRIAVAEAEGWRRWKRMGQVWLTKPHDAETERVWLEKGECTHTTDSVEFLRDDVPDYTTDRNAIIGAIERLSRRERYAFCNALWENPWEPILEDLFAIVTADAETLCKSYLKAKGIDFEES